MAGAKLVVIYPPPTDVDAFERAYHDEHVPMAAPVFQQAGATKVVLSKADPAAGPSTFYRIAEIHFPSLNALQACVASPSAQQVIAHANKISTGGALHVMIANEQVVTL